MPKKSFRCKCGSRLELFAETEAGRDISIKIKDAVIQTGFFECGDETCRNGRNSIYVSRKYGLCLIRPEAEYLEPHRYTGELTREEIFEHAFNSKGVLSLYDELRIVLKRKR